MQYMYFNLFQHNIQQNLNRNLVSSMILIAKEDQYCIERSVEWKDVYQDPNNRKIKYNIRKIQNIFMFQRMEL